MWTGATTNCRIWSISSKNVHAAAKQEQSHKRPPVLASPDSTQYTAPCTYTLHHLNTVQLHLLNLQRSGLVLCHLYQPVCCSTAVVLPGGQGTTPPPLPSSMINLQQATDARIASLQAQLIARTEQLEQLQQQLGSLQGQLASRDGEVSRLAGLLGSGPDVDRLARDQLAAASENIILSLNKQVGGQRGGAGGWHAPGWTRVLLCAMTRGR